MTSVVVIQARTNSSRLPAKALLPIRGLPAVVLAAKRAANTGRQVIVATSEESSDDYLAKVIRAHGIACFRGSLNNALLRFVEALEGYDDETVVFRLTADNVIPDGQLLDEIEQDFHKRKLEYIGCNGANSGLPYGMSAEAVRLKHLRQALSSNPSDYDAEHVTPAIICKLGAHYFEKYISKQLGLYRCTIDCLDDYLCVSSLFDNVNDPVKESAFSLIESLKTKPLQPLSPTPARKLVFGTAQLGMLYGITNIAGQPDSVLADTLVKTAVVNGVEFLDTARVYGESESAIGHAMATGWQNRVKVVTKLSPLLELPTNADAATTNAFVDASLYQSLNALGMQQIDTFLLHRASHLKFCNRQIWNRLLAHYHQGRIKTLGVSIQNPKELIDVLDVQEVEHIQLPLNILDWRWQEASEKILAVKAKRKLSIHARSAYLQGLIFSRDITHWANAGVENAPEIWKWLAWATKIFERSSVNDLCLSFVNSLTWVDGIVVGMETLNQLHENLALIARPSLDHSQLEVVYCTRPKLDDSSLNPALWKRGLHEYL